MAVCCPELLISLFLLIFLCTNLLSTCHFSCYTTMSKEDTMNQEPGSMEDSKEKSPSHGPGRHHSRSRSAGSSRNISGSRSGSRRNLTSSRDEEDSSAAGKLARDPSVIQLSFSFGPTSSPYACRLFKTQRSTTIGKKQVKRISSEPEL